MDAVLYATLDADLFIFHKLALLFLYVAGAITVAALATVFVHTLNAALPPGFTPAVFRSSSRCYSCYCWFFLLLLQLRCCAVINYLQKSPITVY